jgi:hypothetical protein
VSAKSAIIFLTKLPFVHAPLLHAHTANIIM